MANISRLSDFRLSIFYNVLLMMMMMVMNGEGGALQFKQISIHPSINRMNSI